MLIPVTNAIQETWIFSIVFFVILFIFIKPRKITEWFPSSLTTELKGLAIIMIVLSHVGYFLVSDTRFLWPLSIMAGVGVNLFLFLSGFGLTVSQLQKDLGVWQFYKKRLLKLFIPFWISLFVFLGLDLFVLKLTYSWGYIGKAVIGIFAHANLYEDINSPLWYLTFIIAYYLLFPLVFSKKNPWISAIILYLIAYLVIDLQPTSLDYVLHLYQVHIMAFPLGILAAWGVSKLKGAEILEKFAHGWRASAYYLIIAALLVIFYYANYNSGIGGTPNKEQWMSIIAVLAISLVFILKKIEFKIFYWIGIYSYEIYLWHWPIMYRYDIFYRFMPAWLATLVYFVFFVGLAWMVSKVTNYLSKKPAPPAPIKIS
ncbi:MAG: acyltransferase [Candidatus Falkowbacteria bacterium]